VRTVLAALSLFDFSLIGRGAHARLLLPTAILRVLVPALGPAFLTSGMFAFLASMDNYPISILLHRCLDQDPADPVLQYVEENPDPPSLRSPPAWCCSPSSPRDR